MDATESMILALDDEENFHNIFEKLYRDTHSLKSSDGTPGLRIIATIAHNIEEWLNQFHENLT